ncbi:SDR family oxidoreductase [Pseudooceanicola sp. 200-1SW]|uniref:SDR family oxidoreductase n=1 Tax=Pseudooceanicola sp. 200-1SW TaxID=3425949 RepID=UPI003D7F80E5
MNGKILVTGASGQLGALVVDSLLAKVPADQVVALVRRPEAAAPLEAKGVEVRFGSYGDAPALAAAMQGIARVLLISGSEVGNDRVGQHKSVIDAAKDAGVELVAYTSILRADDSGLWLAVDHRGTEKLLGASGLPVALLRNGWYNENLTGALGQSIESGAIIGASGSGRYSPASRADYAEAAAAVLVSDQPAGTYELAGSESFDMAEFAAEVARVSGKPVAYADMSEAELKEIYLSAGLPEVVAHMLADSSAHAANGDLEASGATLEGLIGRKSTPWQDSVKAALA